MKTGNKYSVAYLNYIIPIFKTFKSLHEAKRYYKWVKQQPYNTDVTLAVEYDETHGKVLLPKNYDELLKG
jgi:hypothetical protein